MCLRGRQPVASQVVSINARPGARNLSVFIAVAGLLFCLGSFSAQAQDGAAPDEVLQEMIALLTDNDWRPYYKAGENLSVGDEPVLQKAQCGGSNANCADPHSTYKRDPYYRIEDHQGTLRMYSDGELEAGLEPGDELGTFLVRFDDQSTATLVIDSVDCDDQDPCFQITGSPWGKDLTDNLYVWREREPPNPTVEQSDGSIFVEEPPGLKSVRGCYDITRLEIENLHERGECSKYIFTDLDTNGKMWKKETFGDGKAYGIPYGWKYLDIPRGNVTEGSRIIESESDLIDSQSSSFGWKTGLNLVVFDFSVHHNETTQERTQQMYSQKLVYSRHDYQQTRYALVMDKWNARLHPEFVTEVGRLQRQEARNPGNDDHFQRFIQEWGTHYAYAATVGERGFRTSSITQEQALQLREKGVNVSTGASVGVSIPLQEAGIPGSAGMSAGGDDGTARSHYQKMSSVLGTNFGKASCLGGGSCTGERASGGGPFAAIMVDLRPISDLLGPPFLDNIEGLPELRERLAANIAVYSALRSPPNEVPAAQFLRISGLQKAWCRLNYQDRNSNLPLEQCSIENVAFSIGEHQTSAKPFDSSSVWLLPHPGNLTVVDGSSRYSALNMSAQFATQVTPKVPSGSRAFFLVPPRPTACFNLLTESGAIVAVEAQVEVISGEDVLDPGAAPPPPKKLSGLCG